MPSIELDRWMRAHGVDMDLTLLLAGPFCELPIIRYSISRTFQLAEYDEPDAVLAVVHAECYVEIWLEKDALAGVILPVTEMYDVPLMVARGYASLSFLHSAAEYIGGLDVPTFIYHLGDFDPSGVNAGEKIEESLRDMAPDAEITFERIAVTPEQIRAWNLPTRPTKRSDSRSKGFGDISVELDAIAPEQLRELVREAIEQHLPPEQFEVLKAAEVSEQMLIRGLVAAAIEDSAS